MQHVCPWWYGYAIDNVFRHLINDPRKIVGPYISEGMTVTDIGCGVYPLFLLNVDFVEKYGIDKEVQADIQERAKQQGIILISHDIEKRKTPF